jgi:hypothetical protein
MIHASGRRIFDRSARFFSQDLATEVTETTERKARRERKKVNGSPHPAEKGVSRIGLSAFLGVLCVLCG